MSARLYDEAFVNKLKNWTENTNIKIYSPSDTKRLFEVIADDTNDKPIELPIICLRRPFGYKITNPHRQPLSYGAKVIEKSDKKAKVLNAIPIALTYQVDIYTRYYAEADEFARNLVFNFINYPTLTVVVPYLDENLIHDSTIELMEDVEDNSDIPERFVQGNFTRLSLSVSIPNAYLWDIRVKDTARIAGADMYIVNQDNSKDLIDHQEFNDLEPLPPEPEVVDDYTGRKGIVIKED